MHPILLKIPLPGWKLPLLGSLSAIPIHSYGVMLGLSLVVGWYLTLGLSEKQGMPKETMANCYVFTAVSAVIMARVLYFVTNPEEFKSFTELFALWRGGLVAYGGFLGGLLGSYVFLRRQRLPLLPWADAAVPSLASGLLLTRIGCYLFGCDFGKPLGDGAPGWLKTLGTFPHWPDGTLPHGTGAPAWLHHFQHNLVSADAAASLPVHPTQLYESLVGACLLGLLFWVRRHQKFQGQIFLVFGMSYGIIRFLLEMLRDDPERNNFGPHLPEHIYISGVLLLFGLAFILFVAQAISDPLLRRVAQIVSVFPAVVAFLLLQPASFADEALIQLSTSQWIGVLTGLPSAAFFGVFWKVAAVHPEDAMRINIDEHLAMVAQATQATTPKAEHSAPASSGESSTGSSVDASSRDKGEPARAGSGATVEPATVEPATAEPATAEPENKKSHEDSASA